MRSVLVVGSLMLGGCPDSGDGGLCSTEHLVDSANVSGTQIARVGGRVVWSETDPAQVQLLDVNGASGTTASALGLYAFGRGMAVEGDVVYWAAVLEGIEDSALYATPTSGLTEMVVSFPGCTDPRGLAIEGGRWWVGFQDCGGAASVRTGMGATETAAYPVDEINDLLPGFVLTDSAIIGFEPTLELTPPVLTPRRFARQGDTLYVTGNEQLNAVPLDGSASTRLFNYLPGVTDLVVDDAAVYVATSTDNDPGFYRVPIAGGEPQPIAEHLGSAIAITQDSTHVYWATRGRLEQKGIWRAEKCLD